MSARSIEAVVQMILAKLGVDYPQPPIPAQSVEDEVELFRSLPLYPDLDFSDWVTIEKTVMSKVRITMEPGTTLTDHAVIDWVTAKHDSIEWKRWNAYRELLRQKGYSPGVISNLDDATVEILNCIGDPTDDGRWRRRGLVIGDVQSGKTATYLGVVNRAADAGYKLIVLLAGGTEALRKQTQFRVDEGLLGRDTAESDRPFGVARWQTNFLGAYALTTQATDFRKSSKHAVSIDLDPDSPTPLVFVLKKNKTALENMKGWLEERRHGSETVDVPMLLVDDESDYASVNTKDENSPTKINALIREILALASKSSYMAFTATPFANVFIDHETDTETLGDDLFPKDYIRTLEAPSNYVGSDMYFGSEDDTDSSKLIDLDDVHELIPFKHKSHHVVDELPGSLIDALRTFVVASAIRESRGDASPRSMLVNVSRFKNVQSQVHEMVEEAFADIKRAVELHAHPGIAGSGDDHSEIRALKNVYEARYPSLQRDYEWETVRAALKRAVHNVQVRLINSDRVKRVNDLGEIETDRMIAVGGDVLSRGLTLEGLTVSYFHRLVGASDTLLQMARWFGYRPGYEDLCRVWIPADVADQFRYVSGIVTDLRDQLKAMKKQRLSPVDFGLQVRKHPETLLITARNKMKAAEAKPWTIEVSGARNLETVRLDPDPETVSTNDHAVRQLVSTLEASAATGWQMRGTHRVMTNVDSGIISDFLSRYVGYGADPHFSDSALATFIRDTRNKKLQSWTVSFVPGNGATAYLSDNLSFGRPVRAVSAGQAQMLSGRSSIPLRVSGSSSRLAGSTDVATAGAVAGKDERTEPNVYKHLEGPILLIYLIEPNLKAAPRSKELSSHLSQAEHLVGVKVAIPKRSQGEPAAEVQYMLNSVALRNWRGANFEAEPDRPEDVDGSDDE